MVCGVTKRVLLYRRRQPEHNWTRMARCGRVDFRDCGAGAVEMARRRCGYDPTVLGIVFESDVPRQSDVMSVAAYPVCNQDGAGFARKVYDQMAPEPRMGAFRWDRAPTARGVVIIITRISGVCACWDRIVHGPISTCPGCHPPAERVLSGHSYS